MDEDDQFGLYADDREPFNGRALLCVITLSTGCMIAMIWGIWLVGHGRGWW